MIAHEHPHLGLGHVIYFYLIDVSKICVSTCKHIHQLKNTFMVQEYWVMYKTITDIVGRMVTLLPHQHGK